MRFVQCDAETVQPERPRAEVQGDERAERAAATLRSMGSSEDSSTQTRDIENFNLIHTLKQHPVLGSGFGHEYIELVQADRVDVVDVAAAEQRTAARRAPLDRVIAPLLFPQRYGVIELDGAVDAIAAMIRDERATGSRFKSRGARKV